MDSMTYLLMLLILIALIAVVPQIAKRFHISSVVAIMLVGIAIGPHSLNLLQRLNHFMGRGFPTERLYSVVDVFGLLGLIFLMALAGMEADLGLIKRERKAVAWLSLLTFLLPAMAGFGVYYWFEPDHLIGQLLFASLFASHAVAIVFPIIRELKITHTRFGVAVLASTVTTDIASLVLLAVCVMMHRHASPVRIQGSISLFDKIDAPVLGGWLYVIFMATIALYIVLSIWVMPMIARRVFARLGVNDDSRLTFFLLGILSIVFIGELLGVNVVVGAFIGGMAFLRVPEMHHNNGILHRKLEGLGYGLLVPFLFLSIGMKTNIPILFEAWDNAAIVLATLFGLVFSKVASGWLAMRLSGFDNRKGICAGLMTVPQLSATLAAATIALQLRMITEPFFNAIVCLSIATTIPVPTLVRLMIVKGKMEFQDATPLPPPPEGDEEAWFENL
jgi:Kef-type K+ transport system membrane component KefB